MSLTDEELAALAGEAASRPSLWSRFLNGVDARSALEVGVFRGEFAQNLLDTTPSIERYYMLDPWRHLEDWDKPANRDDDTFERFYQEAMDRTEAHADKRVVLRGRTTEVIDEIPDESLDFAYIDGDHTLRGITIDLIRVARKVKPTGWIGGDDLHPSIFHHGPDFEPTLVFPYSVYFAEALDTTFYALPFRQFVMRKSGDGHRFVDLTGGFGELGLKHQFDAGPTGGERGFDASAVGTRKRRGRRLRRGAESA
jgi:hypothetical protein